MSVTLKELSKKKTTTFLKSASSWTSNECVGSCKTDRIMLFWATPRERPDYILHDDKSPNSCYDFQNSGALPTEYLHIFYHWIISGQCYIAIPPPPANVIKPEVFLKTVWLQRVWTYTLFASFCLVYSKWESRENGINGNNRFMESV